jgi:hypothetical protein
MGVQVPLGAVPLAHGGLRRPNVIRVVPSAAMRTSPTMDWVRRDEHAGRVGESAEAEAAEVGAEFEGLEDLAADSGGKELGDDGGANGG